MDLFSIGEMVIDFTPGSEPGSYIRNPGGAPANVAIAMTRLGRTAGFCGKLGDDDFGRFLLQTLKADAVIPLCPKLTDKAITTLAFVTLKPDGDRSFTFARKPGADMLLSVEDIDDAALASASIIHAGSCSLSAGPEREATKYVMRRGKELGKLVSFDVNYRPPLWNGDAESAKAQIREVLPFVDLLKVSDEEVDMLGGEAGLPELMKANGITLCALTGGGRPTKLFFGGSVIVQEAYKVDAIDTTGAGDAFWGAFLASLLDHGITKAGTLTPPAAKAALEHGMLAGSISVQRYGAIPSLPYKKDME